MQNFTRRAALVLAVSGLAACSGRRHETPRFSGANTPPLYPNETPELRRLIEHYARVYDVPVDLIHRVVIRESRHVPQARNGLYYGLMQIRPQTARTMGFRGSPEALLDADTNLKYAVKYLRGAWLVSNGNRDRAVMWYSKGYYYEAKRRGLLVATGLKSA